MNGLLLIFCLAMVRYCDSSADEHSNDDSQDESDSEFSASDVNFVIFLPNPEIQGVKVGDTKGNGWSITDEGGSPITKDGIYNYTWNMDPRIERAKLYVIVHGYNSNPEHDWVFSMKDSLMRQNNVNDSTGYAVILTDWSQKARAIWYPNARGRIPLVAQEISTLVSDMANKSLINLEDVHCIGHSLGAHTCGLASKLSKFGRVTGLDPAGPGFSFDDPSNRLDKSDAEFVDVIHTDVGRGGANLGMVDPIGHLDFYPNGRSFRQPGCKLPACSHGRAYLYYTSSIESDCFKAHQKCQTVALMLRKCDREPKGGYYTRMGHHTPEYNTTEGIYYLTTGRRVPYCKSAASSTMGTHFSLALTLIIIFVNSHMAGPR